MGLSASFSLQSNPNNPSLPVADNLSAPGIIKRRIISAVILTEIVSSFFAWNHNILRIILVIINHVVFISCVILSIINIASE